MTTSHSISWTDVAREAVDHLSYLLTLGTSSPPAWEFPAARYLLGLFEREGIHALILPPAPSGAGQALSPPRPSLVAHLPGSNVEEPLLLLSHLDAPPSAAPDWEPVAAAEGQQLHGAGALYGTQLAVAHAMALVLLARSAASLRRTIRYAATSEGAGGRGVGLGTLARSHLEHITSDVAIGWGGLSWEGPDHRPCALLATADKGMLYLRVRAEGDGGAVGVSSDNEPVDRLVRALERLSRESFAPRPSAGSRALVRSVASILPDAKSRVLEGLNEPDTAAGALEAIEQDDGIDKGLKALLRASVCTERSVVRVEASGGDGFRPRVAEADVVYCFPPGGDAEALARKALEAIGGQGVYLSQKSVQRPSESEPSPEIQALASAALCEVDPDARLLVGLAPWPTGQSALRDYGTSVFGWEPFSFAGPLSRALGRRGASSESLETVDFVREVRAIYSFLCRASL